MPRCRWNPVVTTDTARDHFDRAMSYLRADYLDDAKDYRDPSDLFEIYANKAAQLGRDLAEDLQTESQPVCPEPEITRAEAMARLGSTPTPDAIPHYKAVFFCPVGRHDYTVGSDTPLDPPFSRPCPVHTK